MATQRYWEAKYWNADYWDDLYWSQESAAPTELTQDYFHANYFGGTYFHARYFGAASTSSLQYDYFSEDYFHLGYFHARYFGKFGSLFLTPDPVTLPIAVPQPGLVAQQILSPSALAIPILAPDIRTGTFLTPTAIAVPFASVAPTVVPGVRTLTPSALAIPIAFPGIVVTRSNPGFRTLMHFWLGGVGAGAETTSLLPDPVAVTIVGVNIGVSPGGVSLAPSVVSSQITPVSPLLRYTAKPSAVTLPISSAAPTLLSVYTLTPSALAIPFVVISPVPAGGSTVLLPTPVPFSIIAAQILAQVGVFTVSPDAIELPIGFTVGQINLRQFLAAVTVPVEIASPTLVFDQLLLPSAESIIIAVPRPGLPGLGSSYMRFGGRRRRR